MAESDALRCGPAATCRKWRWRAGVTGLLMLLALMTGCVGSQATAFNLREQSSWDGQRTSGQIQNNGPSNVACVLVEYALVNRQGNNQRTVSATKQDGLAPRDTWDFAISGASAVGATGTRRSKLQPC